MNTYPAQERRKYKRIKKQFVARFQLKDYIGTGKAVSDWEMVTTQNLGAGGVLFNYDKEIKIGSFIDMLINFPQVKKPINCTGKVIRIDRQSPAGLLKVAAYFLDISEKDKEIINKSAEEFYSKKEGRIEPYSQR